MKLQKDQMRCRACGRRVTYRLSVCPHCGHNPLRFHTRWRATVLSVAVGVISGLALFPFLPHPSASSVNTLTETPRAVALARPTFTPTATATPLPTPPPATPTQTLLPTATSTVVKAPQSTPTPTTAPPTATPRPTVAPPRLLAPNDQAEYGDEGAEIILQWEGVLEEGQQYEVKVRYIDKNNDTQLRGHRTRETRWKVPAQPLYREMSLSLRAIQWDVVILDASGNPVSAPSSPRIFYWGGR